MLLWLLVIVLLIMAVGAAPRWHYSIGWGYGPSGAIGLVLIVLILLFALGQL